jgi:hypothetical protein
MALYDRFRSEAGDFLSPFEHKLLDIAVAEREPEIQPDGMADDLRREVVRLRKRTAFRYPTATWPASAGVP